MKVDLTNPGELCKKLAGRHELSLKVLLDLHSACGGIDPTYDMEQGATAILGDIHKLGLRGQGIWKLFSWLCQRDFRYTVAVLKAYRLGLLTKEEILQGIETKGKGWDLDQVVTTLRTQNPDFDAEALTQAGLEKAAASGLGAPTSAIGLEAPDPQRKIPKEKMKEVN